MNQQLCECGHERNHHAGCCKDGSCVGVNLHCKCQEFKPKSEALE